MYPVKPTGEHLSINLCLVLFAQLVYHFDQCRNIMATFNGPIQSFPNSKADDPKMRNAFLWPIQRLAFRVRLFKIVTHHSIICHRLSFLQGRRRLQLILADGITRFVKIPCAEILRTILLTLVYSVLR